MRSAHIFLVLLVAVLASALVSAWMNHGPAPSRTPRPLSPERAHDASEIVAEQARRIEELEARVQQLETQRLAAVSAPARQAIPSPDPKRQRLEAKIETFLTSLESSGDQLPDQLMTGVEEAMERITQERQLEREQERRSERDVRIEERITEMIDRLGLDAGQVAAVRELLLAEEARREEQRESGASNGRAAQLASRELKEELRQSIGALLTPAQLELYQASRAGAESAGSPESRRANGAPESAPRQGKQSKQGKKSGKKQG